MSTAFIFGLLIALMLTGMPISIALGLTVLTFLFVMTTVPIEAVALKLFTGIESFEIMAIPFFILAGNFLTHGGVARRMIDFATSLIGHWYGGLGLAGVMACALFAAVSGSSPATVVAIGSLILPAMLAQGFPRRFGAGVITTSGALGILIPPSIVMVIYAVATGGSVALDPEGRRVLSASVGQLFMAGVIPGMILASMLGAVTFYRAWKNDYPRMKKGSWMDTVRAFRASVWGLLLIVIVLGGIYTGMFTPTEAAAMSAVYAFVIAVFVYKDMKLADVPRVLLGSANMSAMILYIITNAVLFSFLMTSEQNSAGDDELDRRARRRVDRVPAVREHPAAARRQRDGAVIDRADHRADPVPDRREARDPSCPPGDPDDREHGGRPVPSPGRAQSLRGIRDCQDGHHRAHGCGVAVAAGDAGVPGDGHLHPGDVAVAAAHARHAVRSAAQAADRLPWGVWISFE